jgi:cyd operon protein YbgT
MWYFSWALGVSFAISFSILNALWLEAQEATREERRGRAAETSRSGPAA